MRVFIVLMTLLILPALPATAEDAAHTLTVEGAYSRATAPSQKSGAAFMVIRNTLPFPDKLIAAYSDVAEKVELHTHIMEGDVMKMRQVEYYELPGGEAVTLEPHGHHIMLMGLKHPLESGSEFILTLDFEKSPDIHVTVDVQ